MEIGYARISKADGSQTLDLQLDALGAAGVAEDQVYRDEASGKRDAGLLKARQAYGQRLHRKL